MTRSNIQKNNDRYNYHGSKKEGKEGSSKAKGSKAQASKEGKEGRKAPPLNVARTAHTRKTLSVSESVFLFRDWKCSSYFFSLSEQSCLVAFRAFAAAEHGLFCVTEWSKKVGGETEASPRRGRSGRKVTRLL